MNYPKNYKEWNAYAKNKQVAYFDTPPPQFETQEKYESFVNKMLNPMNEIVKICKTYKGITNE